MSPRPEGPTEREWLEGLTEDSAIDAQAREVLAALVDITPLGLLVRDTLRALAAQPPEVVARVLEIVREERR